MPPGEAFDSVLESFDPTYNYAHPNRGIALYYGTVIS